MLPEWPLAMPPHFWSSLLGFLAFLVFRRRRSLFEECPVLHCFAFKLGNSSTSFSSSVLDGFWRSSGSRVFDRSFSRLVFANIPAPHRFTWAFVVVSVTNSVQVWGFRSGNVEFTALLCSDQHSVQVGSELNKCLIWLNRVCLTSARAFYSCGRCCRSPLQAVLGWALSLRADHRGDQNYRVPALGLTVALPFAAGGWYWFSRAPGQEFQFVVFAPAKASSSLCLVLFLSLLLVSSVFLSKI